MNTTKKLIHSRYQRMQAGFGIIEIMIALFLGVIIMLGVTEVATNNSSTRNELDGSARQMENAAFALREIENDLTNAAFWGEKGAETPGIFPQVCPDDITELKQAMGYPVQGWSQGEAVGSNEFNCVTTDTTDANRITPKVGTDYLAIRRASSCAVNDPVDPNPNCAPAGTNFHLQVHACGTGSTNAGSFEVSNVLANFVYTQRDCVADAPQYRFLNRIYYIKNDQLIRAELVGAQYTETVLVDGVEWMSLEYGMDRSTVIPGDVLAFDGQVDDDINGFTPAPTSDFNYPPTQNAYPDSAWADVVMVRISLVVRNSKASGGFTDDKIYTIAGEKAGETYCADDPVTGDDNDAYDGPCDLPDIPAAFENHRRQLYSRTVNLRNVAGRREEAP